MLDIDALLRPIPGESPAGEDLSFSAEFDAIQEARRSDDATLDQGDWVTELKSADWNGVMRQCGDLLESRSKDLRLAAWMAEACTRTDGFAGLADGYRLVAGLCERYWDNLHPAAEEGEQELRVGNLSWMLSQSIAWMHTIPLTDAPDGRYNVVDLEVAARANGNDRQDPAGHPDTARIDAARAATPFEFYRQLAAQVPLAQEALRELERVVDTRLGQNGPSFSATRDALDAVAGSALRMAAAAGVVLPGDAAQAAKDAKGNGTVPSSVPQASGPITTRREALLQLQQVAEFFRRTEPHSPVAYLADRAARWGNMPLHVWLGTVLKDNPALGQLQELLGVASEDIAGG
jgi:type VI secretion system protein ImpA